MWSICRLSLGNLFFHNILIHNKQHFCIDALLVCSPYVAQCGEHREHRDGRFSRFSDLSGFFQKPGFLQFLGREVVHRVRGAISCRMVVSAPWELDF